MRDGKTLKNDAHWVVYGPLLLSWTWNESAVWVSASSSRTLWGVMWQLLSSNFSHIFHGRPLSPLGSKEAHRPFTQFLAEFKTDPPFITPPPSFLPPSISAHRPLTTDMCEECVCSPSSLPPPSLPSFLCVSHPSFTSVSCKTSSRSLSPFSCFPPTLPLHPFFLSCLRVVSCDQSGGDNNARMWWPNHIRLREEDQECESVAVSHVPNQQQHPCSSSHPLIYRLPQITLFPKASHLFQAK